MKKPTGELDAAERKLLRLLQADAAIAINELAEKVGMSTSSCWRRVQKLRDDGIITGQTILIDAAKAGFPITVIATVSLKDKSLAGQASFERFVAKRAEIQECLLLSGDRDYQLRAVTASIDAYERFLTSVLLEHPNVQTATSCIMLRRVKSVQALPL